MAKIGKRAFENKIKKVMEHNNYNPDWINVDICTKNECWTPVDLVIREYYNNGCGSSKGFLGIYPYECKECMIYIVEHLQELISTNRISPKGWNNYGFTLWSNYEQITLR